MSQSDVLDSGAIQTEQQRPAQKRRILNAVWAPFLQFKLLMFMLGSTALVALLLSSVLYYAFSDLVQAVSANSDTTSYYGEMIEIQLINLFRYCGALLVLYIILLAAVCVTYTHRLVGPLRPFTRHVEALESGNYASRVVLRKGDLELYNEYADKLNALAKKLEGENKEG